MDKHTRREILHLTGGLVAASAITRATGFAAQPSAITGGLVVGHPRAAEVGNTILREGGNAIDAAVAAALAAGVAVPGACGIGGYGGHMVIGLKGGRKVTAIDFNGAAPAAARPDMFPVDERGTVRGATNVYGWLAAGVPGILAGLQLALDRYGTRSLRQVMAPAIQLAEEGFAVPNGFGRGAGDVFAQLRKDPASTRLLFKDGEPLPGGAIYRNPDLAKMLEKLAAENSVASFYRGDIGRRIDAEFQKRGGLVTAKDLADYRAREVEPLEWSWRGFTGTVHLNSADAEGNMVALTLTHGNPYGACVTVDGLGLTIGHGMSRFDVQPTHPNAPGPGKRPLNNMSPTMVLRGGQPVLALGAAGSRMIVNAVCNVVAQFVALNASAREAIAAPRLHTEGNLELTYEPTTPEADIEFLRSIGYRMNQAAGLPLGTNVANAHAIVFDPETRIARAATRDGAAR